MKKISAILVIALCVSLLAGCAGTPVVYYTNCTCPAVDNVANGEIVFPVAPVEGETTAPAVGALKTGLSIVANIGDSKSAAADAEGEAKYDVTMVAVLVDDNGVIQDCVIDGISTSVKFDKAGAITTDLTAPDQTKNELGENYGMVKFAGAVAEWDAQAAALASYAVGKTAEEVAGIAVDETTKPTDADLLTSVTIKIGGFQKLIEKAAQ